MDRRAPRARLRLRRPETGAAPRPARTPWTPCVRLATADMSHGPSIRGKHERRHEAAHRLHRARPHGPRHGEEPRHQGLSAHGARAPQPQAARGPARGRREGSEDATRTSRASRTSCSCASPARRRSRRSSTARTASARARARGADRRRHVDGRARVDGEDPRWISARSARSSSTRRSRARRSRRSRAGSTSWSAPTTRCSRS